MTEKTCARCKIPHPITEFYNNRRAIDGKDSYCKECRKHVRDKNIKPKNNRASLMPDDREPIKPATPISAATITYITGPAARRHRARTAQQLRSAHRIHCLQAHRPAHALHRARPAPLRIRPAAPPHHRSQLLGQLERRHDRTRYPNAHPRGKRLVARPHRTRRNQPRPQIPLRHLPCKTRPAQRQIHRARMPRPRRRMIELYLHIALVIFVYGIGHQDGAIPAEKHTLKNTLAVPAIVGIAWLPVVLLCVFLCATRR